MGHTGTSTGHMFITSKEESRLLAGAANFHLP